MIYLYLKHIWGMEMSEWMGLVDCSVWYGIKPNISHPFQPSLFSITNKLSVKHNTYPWLLLYLDG